MPSRTHLSLLVFKPIISSEDLSNIRPGATAVSNGTENVQHEFWHCIDLNTVLLQLTYPLLDSSLAVLLDGVLAITKGYTITFAMVLPMPICCLS